ncbi:carboxypeptidase-like regulatory domain-containing protein [Chitinophaga nivalis]|uniref:Carboxypeptidase-like regulatory domain-containing protein n=1 Tax=Chitinophaga nivalis TaxID=2991709 RepID=A0ABT3IKF1_9BACT|nr:carboxypeptidase-like regulatory domain-containing protein [Chitinophaga nivalis]MCW3465872.1 carboxypeptidase-like regulatory domain-containing protein [Chitinophaga nivalis]MCW3484437.1 carboxypeptidase-like regulatory domain-containing protein [Chitinophaga nivalis]
MKTTRPLIVSIPRPCAQRLQDMTPVKGGKYCSQCRKTVVDFSLLTDAAISHRLQQANGEVCGSFLPSQLNRPLEVNRKKRWLPVALLTGLLSGGSLLSLQAKNLSPASLLIPGPTDAPVTTSGDPDSLRVIKGHVIADRDSMAVAFGIVTLKGAKNIGTMTKTDGSFTLTIPDNIPGNTFTIHIGGIGYEPLELTATTGIPVTAVLPVSLSTLDKVVMTGGICCSHLTRWQQLKRDWYRLWDVSSWLR